MPIENRITAIQAAEQLGISRGRVLQLIESKRLPAVKFGNAWAINSADLAKVEVRKPGRPWYKKEEPQTH